MLRDYILQCGFGCLVIRNDETGIDKIDASSFSAAIISPGPKTPATAGITNDFIARFHSSKPILGICLGHQALGQFFGMELHKAQHPMHGKTSVIKLRKHPLFAGLPETVEVMRYHSLVVHPHKNSDMEVIATSMDDNEVMAIAHKHLPIAGLQFHPESILTPYGLQMIQNWLRQHVG
jgi:anthranilate synthase/aminodeoxychorismate synthase-like glutamine amidotransferase